MAFCLIAGIPTTIALTPGRDVVAFGQVITVGARPVQLGPAGPARLVQVGNTALDLRPLTVWGPLRPQLTMGPVQRNAAAAAVFDADRGPGAREAAVDAIVDGFVDWYPLGRGGPAGVHAGRGARGGRDPQPDRAAPASRTTGSPRLPISGGAACGRPGG